MTFSELSSVFGGISVTPDLLKFLSRVDSLSTGCWVWTGSKAGRYGLFEADGRLWIASRYILAATGVSIDGLLVIHSCDNPPCVNPAHLSAGTPKENTTDMFAKGRAFRKLTKEQAIEIANLEGPLLPIAKRYGVSRSMVSAIKHGATWSHVTGLPRVMSTRKRAA